jgi:hypothetical protein
VADPIYEIRVEGQLSQSWSEWFDGLTMRYEHGHGQPGEPGCTVLSLHDPDLARLHGVLAQIGNLNLKLISVQRCET